MKWNSLITDDYREDASLDSPEIISSETDLDDGTEEETEEVDFEDDEAESEDLEDSDRTDHKMDACSVCHRTESQGAKLIHMPNGMSICTDCMQKSFDNFSSGFGGNGIQFLDLSNMDFNNLRNMNLGDLLSGNITAQKPKPRKAKKEGCRGETCTFS